MSGIKKMRAAVLLLGCLLLTGMFAGCGKKEETPANTVSVYYINKEETKITAVEKAPEGDTLSEQAEWGISRLKENPVELSLRSPISGFTINSWNVKDDQLVLDMSVEYKKLSPSSEVLVRAAIVRTMTQLEGISYVSVTVGGEALTDSLGNVVGPMTADLFIDNAGNEINAYEKTRLLLYFTNESGERLIGVQTKPVVYSSNISMEKLVDLCCRMQIHMGIIAVPGGEAQAVCDTLVSSGVLAIWNFAPVRLDVPEDVLVRNEDLAGSLAVLAKRLAERID